MTLPNPVLRLPLALVAGIALLSAACTADPLPDPQPPVSPTQMTGPQALDAALAAGCDSQPFMAAVERFTTAHREAVQRTDYGTPTYGEILDAQGAPRLDQVFLASTSLLMNQMHDCQRLIVPDGDGWRYGPLVGLFADPARLEHPDHDGSVVAEAYNFGGGDYDPLGLTAGPNCIWVAHIDGVWSASILVPAPTVDEAPCAQATPSNALAVTSLPIVARTVAGGGANPYPSTTRWMWHRGEGVQYLGFRCENAWCEIVPTTLTPDPSAFPNRDAVPGWSDSQYLAYLTPADTLVVSRLFGTMAPGPAVQLAADEQESRLRDGPLVAAIVTLEGNDPDARNAYRDKMDFHATPTAGPPGTPPTSVERIRMRIQPGVPAVWQGWTDSRGPGAARELVRAVDLPHSGSGTVRWRWFDQDEAGWLYCRQGCCTYGRIV